MFSIIQIMYFIKIFLELFITCICSLLFYTTFTKTKLSKMKALIIILTLVFIALVFSIFKCSQIEYHRLLFFSCTIIVLSIINKNNVRISFLGSIISIVIAYGIEIISVLFVGSLLYCLRFYEDNLFSELLISINRIIISILLIRINRLKNGLNFLNDKNNCIIGLLISGPVLVLASVYKENISVLTLTLISISVIIILFGIFLWIRSAFTRHYRKRLKLRAEEYSKFELAEKSKEIEKLTSENTSLSSIIHLDNHIIQSIENELNKLNSFELTDKLLFSINQRNEYVNDTLVKSKNLPSTGSAYIDSVLADLYIKAASRGIDYNLNVDCDINYLLNNLFSKDDFEILLRETITKSIVSVENNPDTPGRILINISQPSDIYELTIMDNGINKDDNVSISEIIEKSNASILTKNFDDNDSFTNSITVRFDGLKNN